MTPEELKTAVESVWWWHSIEIPGYGLTPGHEPNSRSRDVYMNIPWSELKDKTVLDIGAWDGLYSFLAVDAGATRVVAADQYTNQYTNGKSRGIVLANEQRVRACVCPDKILTVVCLDIVGQRVCDSTPYVLDEAEVCFFFGVLYHLQNPLRALHNVAASIKPGGLLILETAVTAETAPLYPVPMLELVEGERDGDSTNWSYPNRAWVEAALRIIGFEQIEYQGGISNRAAWHARKKP